MEGKIIETLNFDLNRTTSLQLLEAVASNVSDKMLALCKYLLELSLFEGVARKYAPYTLVTAALSISESVLKIKAELKLQANEKAPREEISACFKDICCLLQGGNKYDLTAIRRKY